MRTGPIDGPAGARLALPDGVKRTKAPQKWNAHMACPYLREVVMLSCDAFPVKKMLPLDRLASGNPCLGEFLGCPFFKECAARPVANPGDLAAAADPVGKDKAPWGRS